MNWRRILLAAAFGAIAAPPAARADDLFDPTWANIISAERAVQVGDIITVVISQNAESRNVAQNTARTRRSFDGALAAGSTSEAAALSLDGAYSGPGETRRAESFVTQISATVKSVLANGDLIIAGEQLMDVNGEETAVRVRGRVRQRDISNDNQVLSTRIADAEISYDGHGFVTRNTRPNFLHRALSLLGLGG